MNHFNERIKTLRLEHGFTQQELGDLLGVTAQAISKWETAIATPDIALLPKISSLFNCTIDSLFNRFEVCGVNDKRKTMMGVNLEEAAKIESSDLQGIVMRDVNLGGAEIFESSLHDMNIHHGGMTNLSIRHLDLDGLTIGFSQMNGAVIHDLGGHTVPIRFSENDFKRSIIDRCDLADVEIKDCNLSGLKIKGSVLKDSWLLQPDTYEPMYIEDVDFRNGVVKNCDLSGLDIQECQIDGLRINGIPVDRLLDAYERISK